MNPELVVLINAFEVPEGDDEAFLDGWERQRTFLRRQEGYLSTRLHRSLSPDADFRFVNVALWESEQALRGATAEPEFRAAPVPQRLPPSRAPKRELDLSEMWSVVMLFASPRAGTRSVPLGGH